MWRVGRIFEVTLCMRTGACRRTTNCALILGVISDSGHEKLQEMDMPFPEGFPATRDEFFALPNMKDMPCWEAYIAPRTLDEIEWRMAMKFGRSLPWAVEGFQKARAEIDDLLSKGYVEVGVFNGSPIGGMVEGMTPLRRALTEMSEADFEIVSYFYGDDDRRAHVFVHGMRGEQMRAKYATHEPRTPQRGRPSL